MLETGHYQFFEGGRFGQLQKKNSVPAQQKRLKKIVLGEPWEKKLSKSIV